MNLNATFILFILSFAASTHAQNDSILVKSDFKFTDGIYRTFDEFKNNSPFCTDFTVINRNGRVLINHNCPDSASQNAPVIIENPWGYCLNNSVYINQGYGGNYFRLQIIGALIHYYIIEMNYYDPAFRDPLNPYSTAPNRQISNRELVMDWHTGNSFEFCYRNFRFFLSENDPELLSELESSKKKRKMIYFFLLKYNERHPVFTKPG